ncbi:MAG: SHOCT domain-containing protein, partial [Erysipelotrichales bacterium]
INSYIQMKIDEYQASQQNPEGMIVSVAEEISKFKVLLDQGTISQEEFDNKKKELLNQ